MKEVELTREIFKAIEDIEIGKNSCLCFLHPSEVELLRFINELKFGTLFKIEIQDGYPIIGEVIKKKGELKAKKKIKFS